MATAGRRSMDAWETTSTVGHAGASTLGKRVAAPSLSLLAIANCACGSLPASTVKHAAPCSCTGATWSLKAAPGGAAPSLQELPDLDTGSRPYLNYHLSGTLQASQQQLLI